MGLCSCRPINFVMVESDILSREKRYYHICTDGTLVDWLFKDTQDFIEGNNRLAVYLHRNSLKVLDYVLMDTHIHIVVYGTYSQCINFISTFKRITSRYIKKRYGLKRYMCHIPYKIIEVKDIEQLIETIAYIDRNTIVAGYSCLPSEYKWCGARYFFRSNDFIEMSREFLKYKKVKELSYREIRQIIKSDLPIPKDWEIDIFGMINPFNFLEIRKVESLFKTSKRYSFYISKKIENKIDLEILGIDNNSRVFLNDSQLREMAQNISQNLFPQKEFANLDRDSKIILSRYLYRNFSSSLKQVSRILEIPIEEIL